MQKTVLICNCLGEQAAVSDVCQYGPHYPRTSQRRLLTLTLTWTPRTVLSLSPEQNKLHNVSDWSVKHIIKSIEWVVLAMQMWRETIMITGIFLRGAWLCTPSMPMCSGGRVCSVHHTWQYLAKCANSCRYFADCTINAHSGQFSLSIQFRFKEDYYSKEDIDRNKE